MNETNLNKNIEIITNEIKKFSIKVLKIKGLYVNNHKFDFDRKIKHMVLKLKDNIFDPEIISLIIALTISSYAISQKACKTKVVQNETQKIGGY